MWLAPTTTITSLLLQRFNKSVSSKSCRAALLLIHPNSSSSSSSSSKFGNGGGGTFILQHQQANNHHTTTSSPSSSSSKFGTIILQTNEPSVFSRREKKGDIKMCMLSSSSGSGEEDKDDDDDDQKKKKMVFKLDGDLGFSAIYKDFQLQDSLRMVGSCNGIICLHDSFRILDDSKFKWVKNVYLWNPATRHFRILPASIHIEEQRSNHAIKDFVGFGFDIETHDYKVLQISPFVTYSSSKRGGSDGCMCRVQIYNLSTNSWRLLDGIDSLPIVSPTRDLFGNPQGTYLNGSCFFLGRKPINRHGILDLMLLSFDFTKEIFTIRDELPVCYYDKLVFSGGLGEEEIDIRGAASSYLDDKKVTPRIDFVGGYVFTTDRMINLDFDEGGDGGYWYYHSMWVLNEQQHYSDKLVYKAKPWTKLHEFVIKTKANKHLYSIPRCVSNDGEFALISTLTDNGRNKLMLFNLVTKKDFTIGDRDCRAAYVYKESQVSIMGGGNVLLRWQFPTHGTTYKLKLSAPYTAGYYNGIGLCLTSDTGGCISVRSLRRFGRYTAEGALAMAMLEAIKWAIELELSPIIIESDSKNMVSFFMEDGDDNSTCCTSAGTLWMARCLLKSSKNSISFQYCSSSCNYVADIASKLGRDLRTWYCKDWTANFPGEVVMSLSKDLGLESRN